MHHATPIERSLAWVATESRDIASILIYSICIGILNLAVPLTAMAVVNTVALATLTQQLVMLCAVLFVILALSCLMQLLQTILVEYLQRRAFVRLTETLAERIPKFQIQAMERLAGPEWINRFLDIVIIQKGIATLLTEGIAITLQTMIGLVLLAFYDPLFLGFDFILILCFLLKIFLLGRGAVRTAIDESKAKYRTLAILEDIARCPLLFRTPGASAHIQERIQDVLTDWLTARSAHFRVLLRQYGFALLAQAAANTAVLAIGGHLVISGKITLGQLVAADIVVTSVVASFTKFVKKFEVYYDLLAAFDKVGHLLDTPLETEQGTTPARGHGPVRLEITRGDLDAPLKVEAGERVAILGPNGSGKSSFFQELYGIRHESTGLIDGQDINLLTRETLRSRVFLVARPEIVVEDILTNARIAIPESAGSEETAIEALQKVGLLDSILKLPEGLHTRLCPNGTPLSESQIQLLMVARGLAAKPGLLLLDSVLDELDTFHLHQLWNALDRSTTLLVTTTDERVAKLCDRSVRLTGFPSETSEDSP